MKTWHYSDEPYVPVPSSKISIPPLCYNVTNVLIDTMQLLLDETTTSPWALSFALRSLIHFLGDAHQPMHAVALFSEQFPTGDVGGNIYYFTYELGANAAQLHKVWDNAGLSYQTIYPKASFEANVSRVIQENPREELVDRIRDTNPYNWVLESAALAASVAYTMPQNQTCTEDYLNRVRQAANTQMALAGYRLGAYLNRFFEKRGLPELYTPYTKELLRVTISEIVAWVICVVCAVYLVADRVYSFCKSKKLSNDETGKTTPMLKEDHELEDQ